MVAESWPVPPCESGLTHKEKKVLTEKQIEIASETVAAVVRQAAEKGNDGTYQGKVAEATAQALIKGFNVINQPEQPTKFDLLAMLDDQEVQQKVQQVLGGQVTNVQSQICGLTAQLHNLEWRVNERLADDASKAAQVS